MSNRKMAIDNPEHRVTDYPSPTSSCEDDIPEELLISGIDHVNLLVPPRTIHLAHAFYANVLGLQPAAVPAPFKSHLAWFNIAGSGHQIHINSKYDMDKAQTTAQSESPRHLCFKILAQDRLDRLHKRIYQLYRQGDEGAPLYCDEPKNETANEVETGDQTTSEFPNRFFARDYAGNRLEFSL